MALRKPPPMTPNERQRKCRAGGKGRHRGRRGTQAEGLRLLAQQARALAQSAQISAEASMPPLHPASEPVLQLSISAMAA